MKTINIEEVLKYFKSLSGDTHPLFIKYKDFAIINNRAFKIFMKLYDEIIERNKEEIKRLLNDVFNKEDK